MAARKRKPIDWEVIGPEIEKVYRAGSLSNSQLAKKVGISRQTLTTYIKNNGLTRDLKDKIGRRVDEVLNAELATGKLTGSEAEKQRDQIIVEEVAATHVQLIREHRIDLKLLREITAKLSTKLGVQVDVGYEMFEAGKDADPIKVPIDLEKSAKTLNHLTTSYARLVDLERQAFGIDKEGDSQVPSEVKSVMEMIFGQKEGLPG